MPLTVVSRCVKFSLQNIPTSKVHDYLVAVFEKNIKFDDDALEPIASAAFGSLRMRYLFLSRLLQYQGITLLHCPQFLRFWV